MPLALPDPQLPGNPKDALQSIQRNFEALALRVSSLKITAGSKSFTFSSAATATSVIDHNLGVVPDAVIAVADRNDGLGDKWNATVGDFDSTDFTVEVSSIDGTNGTAAKVYWVAIAY